MSAEFAPKAISSPDGEYWYEIDLDPRAPMLADHRPGGEPLLGTAMSLEAIATAARQHAPARTGVSIKSVEVLSPLIVARGTVRKAEIQLRPVPAGPGRTIHGALVSHGPDAEPVTHLRAWFDYAPWPAIGSQRPTLAVGCGANAVAGDLVYEEFFHGPYFRVIGNAERAGLGLLAKFSAELQSSAHARGAGTEIAPRLLEFALQAAGLLELSTSGRMMIPHWIQRVERLQDGAVEGSPLAYAWFDAPVSGACINIDVTDGRRNAALSVRGYRTVALPYAPQAAGLDALARRLRLSVDRT